MKKLIAFSLFPIVFLLFISMISAGCGGGDSLPYNVNPSAPQNISPSPVIENFHDPFVLPEVDSELAEHISGEVVIKYKEGKDPEKIAKSVNGNVLETFLIGTGHYARIETSLGIVETIKTLSLRDDVVYGEPNYTCQLYMIPDDPYYSNQYGPQICGAEAGWDITTGSSSVIIAIVDTGVNGLHKEFEGKMVTGYNTTSSTLLTGYENSDHLGHGTHVAGIAGASGNNSTGIAGLAWGCKIMPLKIYDATLPGGDDVNAARAVTWATEHGADVINLSLGSHGYLQVLQDAINYALEEGVVVVAAMGNDENQAIYNYPAGFPGVIAVGAINGRDELAYFSTTGEYMSVGAPGDDIYSTSKDGGYIYKHGTSMASPFVTGVCALILSTHPGLTPQEVRSQLELTATDIGSPGFDRETGWGKPDIEKAVGPLQTNKYGIVKIITTPVRPNMTVVIYDASGNIAGTTKTDENGNGYFFYINNGNSYIARIYDYISGEIKNSNPFNVTAGNTVSVVISGLTPPPLLVENFEGFFPPADWRDVSPDGIWQKEGVNNNYTGGTGSCAATYGNIRSEIYSPTITLPAGGNPYLTFKHYFKIDNQNEWAFLWLHDGTTWNTLKTWNLNDEGTINIDLSSYCGKNITLSWEYVADGTSYGYWQIDDVYICP